MRREVDGARQAMGSVEERPLIGLMVGHTPDLLVGLLGILKSGHGFVPLDPEYPAERLNFILQDCGIEILVTEARHLPKAQRLAGMSPSLKHVVCLDRVEGKGVGDGAEARPVVHDPDDYAAAETPGPARDATPDDLCYVIYTSGSTGKPKGVPITHRNLAPLLAWAGEYFKLGAHTKVLQNLSFCFDFGVFELVTTLLSGGTLFFLDRYSVTNSRGYADFIRRHGINTIHSTPTFFREVVAAGGERLETLELLHLGGEALTPRAVDEIFTVVRDDCALYNGYGPTEASVNCAIYEVAGGDDAGRRDLRTIPIGRATADNRLYVLDARLQPVPVGVNGELFVGGAGLSRGYLNRPELTAAAFIPNPFGAEPGARLYRTGDLVRYLPDGQIEFLGRLDHQVKVRGLRIELGEVEAALARHPSVAEAVVIADEGAAGLKRLIAYVVARSGESPAVGELRQFVKQTLPAYMAPSAFVFLDSLPLTPNGKIDRRALPAPEQQGRPESGEGYVAPRTPVEEVVAGVCAEVLGLERVGVEDNLFDLGCHSLLATRIIARLRDALHVELPLLKIFEAPTAAGLAQCVQTQGADAPQASLPPVTIAPRDGDLPLTFAQEQVWFLNRLDPADVSYNVPRAARLKGPLSVSILEKVFTEIVRRHEILRTTFPSAGGRPVQVVHPPRPVRIPVLDLRSLPAGEREAEAIRSVIEQARQPFDLERGPLLRLTLLRLDAEDHVLGLIEHHLVHDGWAQGVLLREFLTLYTAYSAGDPSPLPELPRQFADFAHWQRRWLQGDTLATQLAYWKRQLADAPPVLLLPSDRPRPPVQSFKGAQEVFDLPAALCAELRALSRRRGVTLFMTLLAAFKTLLHRYSRQSDVCVGTGVANRRVREAEGLLGMIINTVALRTDLSGDPTFEELLGRVRDVCLGAYAHQDTPFEKVVEVLNPARSLSYTPVFQVLFSFLDTPMPEMGLPGVEMSIMNAHNSSSKFDLEIILIPHAEQRIGLGSDASDEGITVVWNYSAALFDAETMKRMIGHFRVLLEGITREPAASLSRLPLLAPDEHRRLLARSLGPRPEFPLDQTIHALFAAQAARSPDSPALLSGSDLLTYGQLDRQANRLAHLLRGRGVREETPVGLLLGRSPSAVVAILGVLKAGGAYLPLDAQAPPVRLRQMLADAGAGLVLTTAESAGRLEPSPGAAGESVSCEWTGEVLCLERLTEELAAQPATPPDSTACADDLAYCIYTSGSTGTPKGVMVTHRNVCRLVRDTDYASFGPAHTFLLLAPLSFDASTFELWGALLNGGRLAIVETLRPSLEEVGEAVARYGVTTLWLTAGLFHLLMEERGESLRGVRQLLAGGDVLDAEAVRRAAAVLAEGGGGVVINGYGPTETTTFACCHRIEAGQVGERVAIGRPIAGASGYVLDGGLRLVGEGMVGELYIGGDGVSRGYTGRPELTAERFVPDPFSVDGGGRLYRTGDLVRWTAGGVLEFVGRMDAQVKVRGFRVELGEIEAALREHRRVKEAAVVAAEGGGVQGKRLVAYVALDNQGSESSGGNESSEEELRRHVRGLLPEYMVPSAFVLLDRMPLTPNGKVDRRALPEPAADGAPAEAEGYVAPRTPMEEAVAGVWAEVLGVERVGIHDNFFRLGGHSLLAMQIISRVREEFAVELPLRRLFESPTVAGMFMAIVQGHMEKADDEEIRQILADAARGDVDEVEAQPVSREGD